EACSECKKMQDNVYSNKKFSEYVNSHFVSVNIDIEYDKREGYKVYSTPTFYFLDSNGKRIGSAMVGGSDVETFLTKLQEIEQSK
ncbi:MAG: thioredoxin fold domain-containing protein, partial [Sulfurimonadaceae bacterium]